MRSAARAIQSLDHTQSDRQGRAIPSSSSSLVIPSEATVVLGAGRTMFEGVAKNLALKRTNLRAFGNGNVLLSFVPD
jgi:hypothetical protein